MTEYAKFISSTEIRYPRASDFPGVVNPLQHDSLMRRNGYYPLIGEPEEREGFIPVPKAFQLVTASKTVTRSRQITVVDYEEDPENPGQFRLDENGEKIKSGEHQEFEEYQTEVDDSYIQITEWDYEPIPEPEPEPEPVYEYSKYRIKCKLVEMGIWEQVRTAIERAGYWESFLIIQSLKSDVPELQAALPILAQAFPQVDIPALLDECKI